MTTTSDECDLIIRAGRIVCPASGLDRPGAIGIRGDRFAAVGSDVSGNAQRVMEYPHAVLLPGLIDLHAHPARSGSVFGVDPDRECVARGTCTAASQGDAGADNREQFVRETIQPSRTRIMLAMNLSSVGESTRAGCFEHVEHIDVDRCVAAIKRCRSHVWAVSVNTSRHCCGDTDPREVLRRGLQAASRTSLPILYGMRQPDDWPLEEQLQLLRPGDVVTYCFRSTPHCIVQNGRILRAVREAGERGVYFDVGHGLRSFDFTVAEAAIADGFLPNTISTDLQRGHQNQSPPHDLPLVMSKLRAAGMNESAIFAAVTSIPAGRFGLSKEIGSLTVGGCADLTVLSWSANEVPLLDAHGQRRTAGRWRCELTVRGRATAGTAGTVVGADGIEFAHRIHRAVSTFPLRLSAGDCSVRDY